MDFFKLGEDDDYDDFYNDDYDSDLDEKELRKEEKRLKKEKRKEERRNFSRTSYNDYNDALERIYGKKLFNIFGKQKIWHFSDATLKHYLFERFCMEERIEVLFKK